MRPITLFAALFLTCSTLASAADIELNRVDWPTPEQGVIPLGANAKLPLRLNVSTTKSGETQWTAKTVNWVGKVVHTQEGSMSLRNGETLLNIEIPTADWPYGAYDVVLQIEQPGEASKPIRVPFALAGPNDRFVVFDKPNIARGLEFSSQNSIIKGVRVGDHATGAIILRQDSAEQPWARSLFVNLTDASLRNGNFPVIDVSTVFRQPFDTGVELNVDTVDGGKKVDTEWGRSEKWRLLDKSIDNAFLGARDHGGDPAKFPVDGHDFRVNTYANDAAIRAFWVRAVPRTGDVDWNRLFRFRGIETAKNIFVYAPEESATFDYRFENLAKVPTTVQYSVRLEAFDGREIWTREGELEVPGTSKIGVPVSFEGKGLAHGIYRLIFRGTRVGSDTPLVDRSTTFAISDLNPIAPVAAGDFLYGLDVIYGKATAEPAHLEWADFMGADIIRDLGRAPHQLGTIEADLAKLGEKNLQAMVMVTPAWNSDPDQRRDQTAKVAGDLERMSAKFKDRITFYEIGNEPDLRFFYDGPTSAYVEDYETYYDAIKRGNPAAVVMNGGLSFHMEDGRKRSEEIIRAINPNKIDAWAYHAHGPGIRAEREGYERMLQAIKEADQVMRPLVDTESGVAASNPAQEWEQARTVIEKLAYAQSVGMPAFFYFRLRMDDGDKHYTMTQNVSEPRPSILAYRTMVATLRHHRFVAPVELTHPGSTGFFFQQPSGPGKAAVFWTGDEAITTQNVDLGPGAADARIVDMMGDTQPAPMIDATTAAVTVGSDPVFLKWQSPAKLPGLKTKPSVLELPSRLQVNTGADNRLTARLVNSGTSPLTGTLVLTTSGTDSVSLDRSEISVNVPAASESTEAIALTVAPPEARIEWPVQWQVYLGVDPERVDLAAITKAADAPTTLPSANDQTIAGRRMVLRDQVLNFAPLFDERGEREAAVATAVIDSPRDQTIRVGSSADWWMQVFVDGSEVYSTMEGGNTAGYALTDHPFEIKLKSGQNRIAFLVLSGMDGWKLLTGGPDELLAAQSTGASGSARIEATLQKGDQIIAKADTALEILPAFIALQESFWDVPFDRWGSTDPTVAFNPIRLQNFHEAFPDSDRWFGGDDDLSAKLWVATDDTTIGLVVRVRDDRHSVEDENLAESDAIQIAVDDPAKIVTLAIEPDGMKVDSPGGLPAGFRADARRGDGETVYRISFDRSATDGPAAVNLRILDRDDDLYKQTLTLRNDWQGPTELWLQIPRD